MITISRLVPFTERYALMEMHPLHITLYLRHNAQLVSYDALCFDNLLARCALDQALRGGNVAPSLEPYDLPVPLRCLWRDDRGLPLWASTTLVPVGDFERDVFYQHKRAQTGGFTAARGGAGYGVQTVSGRWMERRAPLPTIVADAYEASCIGNAIEIGRLLEQLSHVGKRRAIGFGEIDHWLIEPLGREFILVDAGPRLARSLPVAAAELLPPGMRPTEGASPISWTPPQWKPDLWLDGWMADRKSVV